MTTLVIILIVFALLVILYNWLSEPPKTKECSDNGFSYGSMCRGLPIGLIKGAISIAKWHNLTKEEQEQVDGVMISDDFREGSVTILIYEK